MSFKTDEEIQSIVDRSKKAGADDYPVLLLLQQLCLRQDHIQETLDEIAEMIEHSTTCVEAA